MMGACRCGFSYVSAVGGSGHARIDIPNVPCLAHDSAWGSLRELDSPIVIDLTDRMRSRVTV